MTQKVERLKLMKRLIMFSLLILAIGCKSKEDNVVPAQPARVMNVKANVATGTTQLIVNPDGSITTRPVYDLVYATLQPGQCFTQPRHIQWIEYWYEDPSQSQFESINQSVCN